MSVRYVSVQWNKKKLVYDAFALAGIVVYVQTFKGIGSVLLRDADSLSGEVLAMRAWGSCAIVLLTLILCLGPLARLDRRFLPLVYNRRHLGVMMCGVALVHVREVLGFYHAWGSVPSFTSMLKFDTAVTTTTLPFPVLGLLALLVLIAMAVTSHDFWQRFFGPTFWKSLHMLVYVAWSLAMLHVAFGAMQSEQSLAVPAMVVLAVALVVGLHVAAAIRSRGPDVTPVRAVEHDGERWLDAGSPDAIPEGRARPVCGADGERIAVVRWNGKVAAIRAVCAHQGGPLDEGKVIDGCLTCPWHGWQYKPDDGLSPPPFTEKLPTHPVRLVDGKLLVRARAQPAGESLGPIEVHEAPS
ncbi:MAG: ferric reductase-like transmembrane domain-containing protein [Deltaproteobacteria bacterium]|nr:ferric reductase-like transmembrane domain-containing protein [Deltaproteobacteria bacterium]